MIKILIGILLGIGFYLVAADLLHLPKQSAVSALSRLGKQTKEKDKKLDQWLSHLSVLFAVKLHLNEYKRAKMEADISTAGMTITPERFVAGCLVKSAFIGAFAIPFFFVFPILSPVIIACAVWVYSKESKSISNRIKNKRMQIEAELPRLVATIEKTLQHNRDVLSILESYKENAGESLRNELSVTIADMRSGNYEIALTRLESRVGSSLMSDVTRGLVGVLRGDETDCYWATLSIKFSDYQRQLLKSQAAEVPGKVKKLSISLLVCFMMIYVVVIGLTLINSLGSIF